MEQSFPGQTFSKQDELMMPALWLHFIIYESKTNTCSECDKCNYKIKRRALLHNDEATELTSEPCFISVR